MQRHRRRHRARRPWTALARGGLVVTVLGVVTVTVVVLVGRGAADVDESVVAGRALSSTPAVDLRPAGTGGQDVVDRGVVRGMLRLRTEIPPDSRTWVAYLIDGPMSLVRFAPEAPYEAEVDTRSLPDGSYTVDEVVFEPASAPRVKTIRVRIDNTSPPVSPSPSRTASAQPPSSSPSSAGTSPVSAPVAPQPTSPAPARVVTPAPVPGPAAIAPGGELASQVVALTNNERAKAGCPALTVDARLTAAARAHSADMAKAGYFSHDNPGGRTPFQRIAAAGYTFSIAAENIAAGQRTAQDVMAGWMKSAGHRRNILNCSLTQIGVGYAAGGNYGSYWTQDFGTP